jgi:sugar transferase (PEP-CTERM/EpsH1 system associated)
VRILALVHRVPYPPNKGEKIRAYHEIKHLAERGHAVDLLTFADVKEDLGHQTDLEGMCREARVVWLDRRIGYAKTALALPRRLPLSVGYFTSMELARIADRWIDERKYEVVFCYSSPMAEYARKPVVAEKGIARIMDFVDVDSDKWAQYAKHKRQPMNALYRFEAWSLAQYERRIAEEFDASTLVSPKEAEMFSRVAPGARRIVDVPNGVDAEHFARIERRPPPDTEPNLVFVGQMDYFANVDGVVDFADRVLPRIQAEIPGAKLVVVGRAPAPEILALASRRGIIVTGAVPDIREHLAMASLMIAPLRIARGIQNKVLEGMAAGLPLVVSPQALEGIDGEHGVHALVADEPEAFARAVIDLARDPGLRTRLGEAGKTLVREKYAWAPAMKKLESLMLECVEAKRSRR